MDYSDEYARIYHTTTAPLFGMKAFLDTLHALNPELLTTLNGGMDLYRRIPTCLLLLKANISLEGVLTRNFLSNSVDSMRTISSEVYSASLIDVIHTNLLVIHAGFTTFIDQICSEYAIYKDFIPGMRLAVCYLHDAIVGEIDNHLRTMISATNFEQQE